MTGPRRSEIYLVAFDPEVGHEIRKTRPAVIIQNDVSNQYRPITIVAAISSHFSDPPHPREVVLPPGSGMPVASAFILNQIRSMTASVSSRNSAPWMRLRCAGSTRLS